MLFNNHVASSITAQGRDLTQTMDKVTKDYWYNQWHLDTELHKLVSIKNVKQIVEDKHVSIYADTDSLFVSFKPAMDHCDWKNLFFDNLDKLAKKHLIIKGREEIKTDTTFINSDFPCKTLNPNSRNAWKNMQRVMA